MILTWTIFNPQVKMKVPQKAQRLMELQPYQHSADPLTAGNLQTDLTQLQARREECSDLLHKTDFMHAL